MKKIILPIILCTLLLFSGCTNKQSNEKNALFVNSDKIDIIRNVDNAEFCLESAIYDGISLYLELDVEGYNVTPLFTSRFSENLSLSSCVDNFYLEDSYEHKVYGFEQYYDDFDENKNFEKYNYLMKYNSYNSNKLILPFENIDIDTDLTYSLTLVLNGLSEEVVFRDLKFTDREYNMIELDNNNSFTMLSASCKVKRIIYTEIRTIVDVEWDIDNMQNFKEEYLDLYAKKYQTYFSVDDYEEFFYLDPLTSPEFDYSSSDGNTFDCRYVFNVVCDLNDKIYIKEYNKTVGKPKGESTKTIFSYSAKG